MRKGLAVLVVILAATATVLVIEPGNRSEGVVSGFVEADDVRVGSRVGGRVLRVHVTEGQDVTAGDLLVELEPFDLNEQRGEAIARREGRAADLARLEAGHRPREIEQVRAQRDVLQAQLDELQQGPRDQEKEAAAARLEQARAQQELAELELTRLTRLAEQDITSTESLDRGVAREKEVRAAVRLREEELALLKEGTRKEVIARARAELAGAEAALQLMEEGFRQEEIAAARAALAEADAAVAATERSLAELRIVAPVDGVVEAIDLQPGDLVFANSPVLSLLRPEPLWLHAYVPANRIRLAVGDELRVRIDALPDAAIRGAVAYVAREAEFTPGNVQTPEERSKLVFRVKLRLQGELDHVRPGMAADVHLPDAP